MRKQPNLLRYLSLLLGIAIFFGLLGADTLQDPTRPPTYSSTKQAIVGSKQLVLNAIFVYPRDRFAMINNQVFRIGDKIGEFTVTNITPYTVELLGAQNSKEVLQIVQQIKLEKH